MPTDDQQVLVTGVASTPASFTVPGNGQIQPKSVYAAFDGTSAAVPYFPVLKVISDGGEVVGIYPTGQTVAAGGSADVSWFPHVAITAAGAAAPSGVILEQFMMNSQSAGGATSAGTLAAGVSYIVTVQGTYSLWDDPLGTGTPNANAMFPAGGGGRASLHVGLDPDTAFAVKTGGGQILGHNILFQMNLGSGWNHFEPDGGPFAVPQANYLYRYTVTGQGAQLSARINDQGPFGDNYGEFQVTIQDTSGAPSGGGGGGALLPPSGADYSTLQVLAGVPLWATAIDGGTA